MSKSFLAIIPAARGDRADTVAILLADIAQAVALNGGALNQLRDSVAGLREGRKSIATGSMVGLTIAALVGVETTYKDADAGPRSADGRKERAAAYADTIADGFRAAVAAAAEARKVAAAARKVSPKVADPVAVPVAVADGVVNVDTAIDEALTEQGIKHAETVKALRAALAAEQAKTAAAEVRAATAEGALVAAEVRVAELSAELATLKARKGRKVAADVATA